MVKKFSLILMIMAVWTSSMLAQQSIIIEGKISFPDTLNNADMQIIRGAGFGSVIYASGPVNDDGTYKIKFTVEEPGQYKLICQGGHESVNFWAEDEDLVINFRGVDTAKVRYKAPTFVHIQGGPDNELMNKLNWESFRNYWDGVEMYRVPGGIDELKEDKDLRQKISSANLIASGKDYYERLNHIARYYADVNSAVVLLGQLKEGQVKADLLARLKTRNPDYGPLVEYIKKVAEKKERTRKLAQGNPAPAFSYKTPDDTQMLGPADFKGKILVIDFWASWCGPCRAEIPNLKEAYESYKNKGVEILSVSLDKSDSEWRKAMTQEGMPWPQIRTTDAGKEVMTLYQFSGIPHIVVIDNDGNIIGKNYRGKALMDQLEKLTSGK